MKSPCIEERFSPADPHVGQAILLGRPGRPGVLAKHGLPPMVHKVVLEKV